MQGRAIATWTVVAALCLAYYAAAISASADKSAAYDEGLHLVAGYSYWTHGDFRLQPENGNLPQPTLLCVGFWVSGNGERVTPVAQGVSFARYGCTGDEMYCNLQPDP